MSASFKQLMCLASIVTVGLAGCLGPAQVLDERLTQVSGFTNPDSERSKQSDCGTVPYAPLNGLLPGTMYDPGTPCEEVAHVMESSLGALNGLAGNGGLNAFTNYVIPGADNAAEPLIGVSPAGNIYYKEKFRTYKSTNGGVSWAQVFAVPPELATLDRMMWVDTTTGRVFLDHLYVGCSQLWYSDNEGSTWTYTPAACGTPGNDHQKVVSGPYHAGSVLGPTSVYPNAVYYCYNGLVYTGCSLSQTGGLTWSPAVVADTFLKCGGLAGHPYVAGDGTLYVPVSFCPAAGSTNLFPPYYHGVLVSEDNGLTWVARSTLATGLKSMSTAEVTTLEPDVATTPDGTLYMSGAVASGSDNLPYAFISTDKGATWTTKSLVGSTGVKNTVFPVATAGINGRAAIAFLGSTTSGSPNSIAASATWQLYVSFTYDAGATWTTEQASPSGNPVQRGCIWLNGGSSACRNLLDFIDVTHDNAGNVVVGYADGCVSATCVGAGGTPSDSRAKQAVVAKQTSGTPLL